MKCCKITPAGSRQLKTSSNLTSGGGLQLPKYAATLVDTNTNEEQSLQKASEHLFVIMYLKNADQA
eukprot:12471779-Ditylum_brightwellii.AAC.1